jgi:hypothetical protein
MRRMFLSYSKSDERRDRDGDKVFDDRRRAVTAEALRKLGYVRPRRHRSRSPCRRAITASVRHGGSVLGQKRHILQRLSIKLPLRGNL